MIRLQTSKPVPGNIEREPFQRRVDKPWGWEIIWAENDLYTGKLIHVRAGERLSLQFHDQKSETQCLLTGKAILTIEDDQGVLQDVAMQAGNGYTIRPFQTHRITALSDSEIVEVSEPERGTTVRIEDDYGRPDETETVRSLTNRGWST